MRKVIAFTALAIAAVLGVGIAATSVTQNVLASRNVGAGTFVDTGGNGGVGQSGSSTANSGAAWLGNNMGSSNNGVQQNTGDWGGSNDQQGGINQQVGCGHIVNPWATGGVSANAC